MATIEPVSSTVSAPAWFDVTPVKLVVNRQRRNHQRHMIQPSLVDTDSDGSTQVSNDKPIQPTTYTLQRKSTECLNSNHQDNCHEDLYPDERDPSDYGNQRLAPLVDDESTRQEVSTVGSLGPPLTDYNSLNRMNDDYSQDPTDAEISLSASFTTLSAFSLITPPQQWIQKDSFLHRRKMFEQWGVPLTQEMKKTTSRRLQSQNKAWEQEQDDFEQILQERLVWIKYKSKYWWPAILYDNYRQLLDDESLMAHVWYRIPLFWQRLNLAVSLVFNPSDPRNQMPVARVLGRGTAQGTESQGTVEVVEVQAEDTWPFKDEGKLAQILKEMALNGDFFRDHPSLYLDWHQGMDEMEQLLRDCLGVGVQPVEEDVSRSHDSLAAKQTEWKERYQQKKRAKAVVATLTAIAESAPNKHGDSIGYYDGELDDNSLLDASIISVKSPHENNQNPAKLSPVVKGNRTWLQRAKDAEREQLVAKCHACSTHMLDGIESICLWKDNLVAAALEQPTRSNTTGP